ncbi:LysM peptidoglycan-binding domain-containing protein [Patescibacteria group bacterium]
MAEAKKESANSKDGLALIVGGLFVLALVFATYNYFNAEQPTTGDVEGVASTAEDQEEPKKLGEKIKDLFKSDEEKMGDLDGDGASTEVLAAEDEDMVMGTGLGTGGPYWVANDYVYGDISGSSHVVISGDTLWEIAEARYNSGFEWTKILGANSASVGFLPNGQQALIMPGQTLVLP